MADLRGGSTVGGRQIALKDDIDSLNLKTGQLASLSTTNKIDLISAINEVSSRTGDLTTLSTTNKATLVAAINEVFQNASDLKTSIAAAITARGVSASSSETSTSLASKITSNIKYKLGDVIPSTNYTAATVYTMFDNTILATYASGTKAIAEDSERVYILCLYNSSITGSGQFHVYNKNADSSSYVIHALTDSFYTGDIGHSQCCSVMNIFGDTLIFGWGSILEIYNKQTFTLIGSFNIGASTGVLRDLIVPEDANNPYIYGLWKMTHDTLYTLTIKCHNRTTAVDVQTLTLNTYISNSNIARIVYCSADPSIIILFYDNTNSKWMLYKYGMNLTAINNWDITSIMPTGTIFSGEMTIYKGYLYIACGITTGYGVLKINLTDMTKVWYTALTGGECENIRINNSGIYVSGVDSITKLDFSGNILTTLKPTGTSGWHLAFARSEGNKFDENEIYMTGSITSRRVGIKPLPGNITVTSIS